MSFAPEPSRTHLVLIPSFDTGPKLRETVEAALQMWRPVWVVIDGSTDGSGEALSPLEAQAGGALRVFTLPQNRGKGAAILHGLEKAVAAGFTHVLCMDADGQHPVDAIPEFMSLSAGQPGAMILGEPVFDSSAPGIRVGGRKISNWWVNLETLWGGIHDSLFGFRVYPAAALLAVMRSIRHARRFDFDAEVAVRLYWRGTAAVNRPVPVRYLGREEGGVSHFRYVRDNVLLTWMHVRLLAGFLVRLPVLVARRLRQCRPVTSRADANSMP